MKARKLTVVMYHYVRPIKRSRYPGIKGLEVEEFAGQLDYLEKHYRIVTMEALLAALRGEEHLPGNAALLTFDDGYADHHAYVLPILARRRLQGSFFVPAEPVESRRVLDVNKLHLILSSVPDTGAMVAEIERHLDNARRVETLPSTASLRAEHFSATRFDEANIAYTKRLLQRVLPEVLRGRIVATLFEKYVSTDEAAIAEQLYLSPETMREMSSAGMHIGGHGARHYWLGSLPEAGQRQDIEKSIAFIRDVTGAAGPVTFCYPYGDHNADTRRILKEMGCPVSFTTVVDLATVPGTPPLEIPRLDTNDLPRSGDAPPNAWTQTAA